MSKFLFFLVIFFTILCLVTAEETISDDYNSWIGMTLNEAYTNFGVPESVFTYRGLKAEYDDVVFFREGVYLFWFNDRVWQVRFDKNYTKTCNAINIGMSQKEVLSILGPPWVKKEDSDIFTIKNESYPIRFRIFYEKGIVTDLYLYRGDF